MTPIYADLFHFTYPVILPYFYKVSPETCGIFFFVIYRKGKQSTDRLTHLLKFTETVILFQLFTELSVYKERCTPDAKLHAGTSWV